MHNLIKHFKGMLKIKKNVITNTTLDSSSPVFNTTETMSDYTTALEGLILFIISVNFIV